MQHFQPLLALLLLISSWLCRLLLTACALSYVLVTGGVIHWIHCPVSAGGQGQWSRPNSQFVRCLVSLGFFLLPPLHSSFWSSLSSSSCSFKKCACTRACHYTNMEVRGQVRLSILAPTLFEKASLVVYLCVLQANCPRGLQGFTCFLTQAHWGSRCALWHSAFRRFWRFQFQWSRVHDMCFAH